MKTLTAEYAGFVARLRQLQPTSKALWGVMNVNEMLVHVAQPLSMAVGKTQGIDESNWFTRTILKFIALRLMSKIPKGIKAPKQFDVRQNGIALQGFEEDRNALLELMQVFRNDTSVYQNRLHPSFGAFDKREWDIQSYLHLDHHFRQFGI